MQPNGGMRAENREGLSTVERIRANSLPPMVLGVRPGRDRSAGRALDQTAYAIYASPSQGQSFALGLPAASASYIAEAVFEDRLVRDIRAAGARGCTRSEVRRQGSRGTRVGDVEGANVRLERLVSCETSEQIPGTRAEGYVENYAIVSFMEDVAVVRGDTYG